jgi:hypothetical protein
MAKKQPPAREKSPAEHLREAQMRQGRAALYLASPARGEALSRATARKWVALTLTVAFGAAIIWALAF